MSKIDRNYKRAYWRGRKLVEHIGINDLRADDGSCFLVKKSSLKNESDRYRTNYSALRRKVYHLINFFVKSTNEKD